MKRHCEGPPGQTSRTHQVGDQNNYQNSPLFDFPKMIDPTKESQEEDSLEEEDSPEEEDIPEEEECRQEDHPEEVGGHHRCLYHKPTKGSW